MSADAVAAMAILAIGRAIDELRREGIVVGYPESVTIKHGDEEITVAFGRPPAPLDFRIHDIGRLSK